VIFRKRIYFLRYQCNLVIWFFLCWCCVLRWIWYLWCYSEWIYTQSNITNIK
jgi:hypothetical protein